MNLTGNHLNLFTHGDSGFINVFSDLNFFLIHRVSRLSIIPETAIRAGYMTGTAAPAYSMKHSKRSDACAIVSEFPSTGQSWNSLGALNRPQAHWGYDHPA